MESINLNRDDERRTQQDREFVKRRAEASHCVNPIHVNRSIRDGAGKAFISQGREQRTKSGTGRFVSKVRAEVQRGKHF